MNERMKMKVIEPRTFQFVESAIPVLAPMDAVSHDCPHCGIPVRYPLHVASGDLEAMQKLLSAAVKWLWKSGATADVIAEIMAIATIASAKKLSSGDEQR